ncbi:MAG: DUF4468 domain-containing protein [Chitinophagaceae bacterium]
MKLIFTFFLLVPFYAFTQTALPTDANGKVKFEEVVLLDSTSNAKQLYSRSLAWFAETFKSSKSVIEMQDPNACIVIGKGNFLMDWPGALGFGTTGRVSFTINVASKDSKSEKVWLIK